MASQQQPQQQQPLQPSSSQAPLQGQQLPPPSTIQNTQQLPPPQDPQQYGSYPHSPHSPHSPHFPPQGFAQPAYPPVGAAPSGYYPAQGFQNPSPQQGYGYQPQQFAQGYMQPQQQGYPPQPYPPQPGFGAPPPGQFPPAPLKPVSEGYIPNQAADPAIYNPRNDAEVILKALQGDSLDRKALIRILPSLSALQVESIRQYLWRERSQDLHKMAEKTRLGLPSFQHVVRAILLGPLEFDVWLLKRAVDTTLPNEKFLNLILLGRKNGDIEAIKTAYQLRNQKSLASAIKNGLYGDAEALFLNALEARRMDEDPRAVTDDMVKNDVHELYLSMVGKTEGYKIAEIMATRSDAALVRIMKEYEATHGKNLLKMLKSKLKGQMEDSVVYILEGAMDRAARDARLLEGTMKGIGTKDEELNYRLVKLHWDVKHFDAVKTAYNKEYPKKKGLIDRVQGETSGDHEDILVAILRA